MEHARGVILHFGLFKIKVLGLIVRNASGQGDAAVLILCAGAGAATRWPRGKQISKEY